MTGYGFTNLRGRMFFLLTVKKTHPSRAVRKAIEGETRSWDRRHRFSSRRR